LPTLPVPNNPKNAIIRRFGVESCSLSSSDVMSAHPHPTGDIFTSGMSQCPPGYRASANK
jgi:hypothetical protein